MIEFKYRDYEREITTTLGGSDCTVTEVVEQFALFLLSIGYQPSNINELINLVCPLSASDD